MPRRLATVRVRTTVVATAAVGVALILGAWALVAILERSLIEGVQSTLELRSADVAALARLGTLGENLSLPGQSSALVQVIDPSGRVAAASAALGDRPPIGPFRPPNSGLIAWSERLTSDDEMYRIVGVSTTTPTQPVTIYTAASLEAASDSVTRVKVALATGLPLLLSVVAATCWWIVGRALRPVEAIRAQVAEIGSGGVDVRVPEPPVEDEIGRLARTMNAMLDRLQAASDRERRFVADASHELRSPIASLRTQIEVQQRYSASNGDEEEVLTSQLAEVNRMERLVRDLLVLARADERKMAARMRPVRLQDLVLEEVAGLAAPGHPEVDVTGVNAVTILGDPAGLGRVVRNVLENALRHARSTVVVTVRTDGDDVELRVANDGPEIPAHARERIFERFTRLDQGRSRGEGGAGLGLAIVREIVLAHGGRIRVDEGGPGACFVICLPARGPRSRSEADANS